ncbi:coenzyme F420-0:L-glutamate ligase [Natranaerofaba carboxydovora]|uniref:coenzyme F420-0:L-glutamate ligase n=1 Tax=Natranaerofaba carboxydovora TaxID=2742683 RepID=UPI001F13B5F8|nr:coenzyme F420-0:L-glutamate ligase [Natranaerofaba carboxydovora]UMZ72630.1 F420-0:Gamma-glutamyl ligase [Natranaerofaba carboxydovora]
MVKLPDYVGPCAFGIKMGVVLPGSDLKSMIMEEVRKINNDSLLDDGDALSITESVLARAQENYITTDDIAKEVRSKLNISDDATIGVLFPILSRNRFSMMMEGIAMAVPNGKVIVQLSYPDDEVGNQLIPEELAEEFDEAGKKVITEDELNQEDLLHPITGVNYLQLYKDVIEKTGADYEIILSNDPLAMTDYNLDAAVSADIHTREKNRKKLEKKVKTCTLQDLFNDSSKEVWSEWGLLGSNMSSDDKLKLAPYNADDFACAVQDEVKKETGKKVEVLVSGDGAYKDPTSGIYELADPKPAFGTTPGLKNTFREGVKYKYLVDLYHNQGKSEEEIAEILDKEANSKRSYDEIETEGTTPRQAQDLMASLADLISGSADAGTPLILIKNLL